MDLPALEPFLGIDPYLFRERAMVHFHVSPLEQGMPQRFCSDPGVDKHECGAFTHEHFGEHVGLVPEIIANIPDIDVEVLCYRHLDDREWTLPAHEPRNIFGIANRGGKADALELPGIDMEPFKGNRQLGAALAAGEFMDLVDDNKPDICKVLPEPFPHEESLHCLGCGDKEVRGTERLLPPFGHGRVPVTDPHGQTKFTAPPLHP